MSQSAQHTVIPANQGWAIVHFEEDGDLVYDAAIVAWVVTIRFDAAGKSCANVKPVTACGSPDWECRWYRQPSGRMVLIADDVAMHKTEAWEYEQAQHETVAKKGAAK